MQKNCPIGPQLERQSYYTCKHDLTFLNNASKHHYKLNEAHRLENMDHSISTITKQIKRS
uniref:Uncharacterized protein n=1 Tax=Rhizophora mucronata TaxID=61149 RepID=A0A2P2QSE6_RHIMU